MHLNAMHSNALTKHVFEMLSNAPKCNALKCTSQTDLNQSESHIPIQSSYHAQCLTQSITSSR